ncbi:MAG: glycosyltransferase family 39 protein [Candidatus Wildermuthbacteria bacterium]|nr:glycosyltransferase family 39 protein [Candidatus Wildermuthbacteria bacterium]
MSNRTTFILATLLLAATFLLAFSSMKQDALTFDEKAHIAAGYSYLTQQDYRINPEHPPLAKDLAAFPLLFMNLNFPEESQTWKQDSEAPQWWVQFDLGNELLYQSGNNPRQIILWSRLPMILLLLALGAFLFKWAREIGGNIMGLGVLALFAFSPTFLAHGRLVTTDVAAAFGVVVGTYYWLKFLRAPSPANIAKAGIALGIALLLKFTTILLFPFFGILTVLYPLLFGSSFISSLKSLAVYTGKAVLAGIIAFVFVVWPVYQFHILNYPAQRQLRDTVADLRADGLKSYENLFAVKLIEIPGMRPFAQYFRGVLMAAQRGQFGNTTYFMGEVSAKAKAEYFPVLLATKTPIAFPILLAVGLIGIL